MRVALPIWNGRISPVFDEAGTLLLLEIHEGGEDRRTTRTLDEDARIHRAQILLGLHVDVLICGAISRRLEASLHDAGISVIPRICGEVDGVIRAFIEDRLHDPEYTMPGVGITPAGQPAQSKHPVSRPAGVRRNRTRE